MCMWAPKIIYSRDKVVGAEFDQDIKGTLGPVKCDSSTFFWKF